MNYIKSLELANKKLEAQLKNAFQAVSDFQGELLTPKYQGADLDGGRKDWMSTSDINDRLNQLKRKIYVIEATCNKCGEVESEHLDGGVCYLP